MERSNPELASAMKKMQRTGALKDPMKAQAAMSQISREERHALLDMQGQQGLGVAPEATNRQMGPRPSSARCWRGERRPPLDMQEQQGLGVAREPTNRHMRRRLEKAQKNARR